ncbi:hypothetical protein SGQ44_17955 [Flavobacterium sp. Fl-77]|uniref:Uncharacterized protein n=1 Tax=Flavobacterium flavipigmentatum TaxID=2893884 RepID=A0AAJ2SFR5_9FLAO|nr:MULTISPECIES: hypothetical protein [unclassified Flavobacterium]MDX6184036.1 hypothetical protein [Flavobacterium sp. Fl-33]MDX6187646.1 hypothetical protein [Flavobacterium sp. Fl-77]UFH39212.1 hypothetical protein LNP22_02785 [Flavobacterium sp. F-70]
MNVLKILLFIALFSFSNSVKAQKVIDTVSCPISQNELLLSGKRFASAPPILLRVFNEDYEYAVFQLGKRKSSIFLYFKIFTDNVCVKQKQPLELYFTNGDMYILKNDFNVNCDGTAALQLTRRDIKKLMGNSIKTIKFYTLKRDYEFSPSASDNQNIRLYLHCLKKYKIKRR